MKNPSNKKFLLIAGTGFLFLSLFLFWPKTTSAAPWTPIVNVLLFIPYTIIAAFLVIALAISWGFAALTGTILDISISPSLISLSYTNPANNPIIEQGLRITQSFVNMLLVLGLIYIALCITLKMRETQAKKMLAKLIIVALLVNFAPVLCGLVVDASNIAMNSFLKLIEQGVSGTFTQLLKSQFDMIKNTIWENKDTIKDKLDVLIMGTTQIILNICIGFAFFLFAGIFIVRYVAIWILVILAPIAFVFWALSESPIPQIKKMWDMWLNNFIQWSIIGIPIAFFLTLAAKSFSLMTDIFRQQIKAPEIGAQATTYLDRIFPYFVVLVFLYLGFIIGLSTSAMGASATISATKKIGRRGLSTGKTLTNKALSSKWAERTKLRERLIEGSRARLPGVRGKSLGGKVLTTAGYVSGVIPAYWATRRGIGQAALKLSETGIEDIKTAQNRYKNTSAERKASALRRPRLDPSHKIAALMQAIEEGQISDIKKLGITDDEIKNIGKAALKIHPNVFKNIRDAFPHLAEEMGKDFSEKIQKETKVHRGEALRKGYSGVTEQIIAEIKPTNIPKVDSSIFDQNSPNFSRVALEAAEKHWTSQHWAKAGENFGKKFADTIRNEFRQRPQNFTKSAQKYFTASPAGKSLYGI